MNRTLGYFLSLSAITLVSAWLAALLAPTDDSTRPPPREGVDHYATGITRTETFPDGQIKSVLLARALRHFIEDDRTEFERPELALSDATDPGAPPWQVRAATGTVSADGETVLLGGEAQLDRAAYDGRAPLRVLSQDLTVHPADGSIETTAPVEIINPPRHTRAVGMKARFKDGAQITLLSQVRDLHE